MTTRRRGELTEPEEALLGIVRPTVEQEEAAERKAAEEAEVRRLYLARLMSEPLFREWLSATLLLFGAFANPFGISPAGYPDPLATQFALGRKSAGLELWEMFDDAAPDLASLMRRERAGK
jgi:hypothetical protein